MLQINLDFICYDDAFHLRRYAKMLASVEMVVDKMHMRWHTDMWCKEHCDAAKFCALDKVFYSCICV